MTSPTPLSPDRPWYSHITVDLLARLLHRSLFHPFIAWIIPLSQRAVGAPANSVEYLTTCAWAAFVTVCWILSYVDRRIAYGRPREVDWNEEVVVITGGARGLGKILAETYGMRGASVAVLDVQEPDKESEGLAGVQYYRCDVGSAEEVEKAKHQIEQDLGTATILINNAGIVSGKPLLSLTTADVQKNFNVNLLAHFHTLHAFLPDMLRSDSGGTIVTISSVLGKLGASHLSDYTAAKAGLVAMHRSLRAELSSPTAAEGAANIRTILATPGQLSTSLFASVETPSPFFGPVVEPVELAREIARMIDAGENGEISLPLYARWIDWLFILPPGLQAIARWFSGVDLAMEKAHAAERITAVAKQAKAEENG